MFNTVLARGQGGLTYRGAGALASFLLHGAGLAAALAISARAGAPTPKADKPLPFFRQVEAPKQLDVSFKDPAPARPAAPARAPQANAMAPAQRTNAKPPPSDPTRATPSPTAAPMAIDGTATSGSPDAPTGSGGDPTAHGDPDATGVSGTGPQAGGASGTEVVPFGPGMTRPQRIAGADPAYTREAIQARVEGKVLAKCVVAADGTVRNCAIIKGLPYMNDVVLQALAGQRFRPALFQGRPTSVSYVFSFNFSLP
jgi:protein TonB